MCPGSLGCGVSGLFSSIFFLYILKQKKMPDGFSCQTKLKMHVDQNCLKILRKLRKVVKLGKMLLILIKLVSDYFQEILASSVRA